jgi:hypothetical protein
MTMRFDIMEAEWLDRSVDWLRERGIHAYLAVEDGELPMFQERFAGQSRYSPLNQEPIVVYDGGARVLLYDLWGSSSPPVHIVESYDGPRCTPPAEPPPFEVAP